MAVEAARGSRGGRPYSQETRRKARRLVRQGYTRAEVAQVMRPSVGTIGRWTKDLPRAPARGPGSVPVGPLARAFLDSGLTAAAVARELGWQRSFRGGVAPDGDRLMKTLGLYKYRPGGGRPAKYRQHIVEDKALAICRALGVDPMDVGL